MQQPEIAPLFGPSAAVQPITPHNVKGRVSAGATRSFAPGNATPSDLEAGHVDDIAAAGPSSHGAGESTESTPHRHEALLRIGEDLISEEDREIDPHLKRAFIGVQRNINDWYNASEADRADPKALQGDVDRARELLLEMNGLKQEDVNKGFARGGKVYAWRSLAGNLLPVAAMSLIFVGSGKQAKGHAWEWQLGYLASAIVGAVAGYVVNTYALLHVTPIQDAEFDGASDNMVRELRDTKNYPEIQKNLETINNTIEGNPRLRAARDAFMADPGNEELARELEDLLDQTAAQDKNDIGVQHYRVRAQLNRVYIGGLQWAGYSQAIKFGLNLGAGWAAYARKDPRMAAYLQIAGFAVSTIFTRLGAPADQIAMQNAMLDIVIMARPLSGEYPDTGEMSEAQASAREKDDREVRAMVRTPLEVRATCLLSLAEAQVEILQQEIASMLGMSTTQFRRYQRLKERDDYQTKLESLEKQFSARIETLEPAARDGHWLSYLGGARTPQETRELAHQMGMAPPQFETYLSLSKKEHERPLSPDDRQELDNLCRLLEALNFDAQLDLLGVNRCTHWLLDATKTRDYRVEAGFRSSMAAKLNMSPKDFNEFYYLLNHRQQPLSQAEREEFTDLRKLVDAGLKTVQTAKPPLYAKYKGLLATYEQIKRDPVHIKERRFAEVSDQNAELVHDGMQVTRGEAPWELKAETPMLLEEGHRRSGDVTQVGPTYAAQIHRAFQLLVTGSNGPLILNALATLGVQGYAAAKAHYDPDFDPAKFTAPVWPKALATGLIAGAWLLNMHAVYRIAQAKLSPLGSLWYQILLSSASSIAEMRFQVNKLDTRTYLREKFGESEKGSGAVLSNYWWDILSISMRISDGLAVLLKGGAEAQDAREAYEERQKQIRTAGDERAEMRDSLRKRRNPRAAPVVAGASENSA
jgi:hypothetical protein